MISPDFILDRLIGARKAGLATSEQPRPRRWFLEKIEAYHSVKVEDREFRDIINTLADAKHPVCTTNKGYYYALNADEMEPAIQYLVSYAREIEKRIRAMRETQDVLRKRESDLFEHPTVKAIRENFGPIERVAV